MKFALLSIPLLAVCSCLAMAPAQTQRVDQPPKPAPSQQNVRYGPHERNVLDLWRAPSSGPAPLVIYIHGGGFRQGDKNSVSAYLLEYCLEAGISVAAINYRLSHQAPYPAPMHDSARAVQYLRSRAGEWNLNPKSFAATGGSAGAGISLWLGFHDDLANGKSKDPVERQSTRLSAMAVVGAQCSYDPRFITKLIGAAAAQHPALPPFFGIPTAEWNTERAHRVFTESASITHLSAGDPPVIMYYSDRDEPLPADAKPGDGIHHPNFGFHLKKEMDKLGIESVVRLRKDYPEPVQAPMYREMVNFLKKHLPR